MLTDDWFSVIALNCWCQRSGSVRNFSVKISIGGLHRTMWNSQDGYKYLSGNSSHRQNMLMNRKISLLYEAYFELCFCLYKPIFCTSPDHTDWWHKQNIVIFFLITYLLLDDFHHIFWHGEHIIQRSAIEFSQNFIMIISCNVTSCNLMRTY